MSEQIITVKGARENNLKNINVTIPRRTIVAIVGVSGSGKSSLLFNTLASESAVRHEIVSTNATRRTFEQRPDVDAISGLPYCSVVSQRGIHRTSRSTVATFSGIHDALRYLTIASGEMLCHCGTDIVKPISNRLVEYLCAKHAGSNVDIGAVIVRSKNATLRQELMDLRQMGFEDVLVQTEDGGVVSKRSLATTKTLNRDHCNTLIVTVGVFKIEKRNRQQILQAFQRVEGLGIGEVFLTIKGKQSDGDFVLDVGREWPCPKCHSVFPLPTESLLSFNSEASRSARCTKCEGLGSVQTVALHTLVPDQSKSIDQDCFALSVENNRFKHLSIRVDVLRGLYFEHGVKTSTPFKKIPDDLRGELLYGAGKRRIKSLNTEGRKSGASVLFHGFIPGLQKLSAGGGKSAEYGNGFVSTAVCDECDGTRFDPLRAGIYHYHGIPFTGYLRMTPDTLLDQLKQIGVPSEKDAERKMALIMDVLGALLGSGLSYIRMDRSLSTLSGGESQRLKIAGSLCSGLTRACYILDEPSLGLHATDNAGLLKTILGLRDLGNTVLIADHDPDFRKVADSIIELGPEGGTQGGEVIDSEILASASAKKSKSKPLIRKPIRLGGRTLCVSGCSANNLKNIDVLVPLGGLVCLTGVSGSGKSSFAHHCLHPAVTAFLKHNRTSGANWNGLKGAKHVQHVASVGQQAIGTSAASLVVTYLGIFERIRRIYASTEVAVERGYTPSHFSHNRPEGQCPVCAGRGNLTLVEHSMNRSECSACAGGRFVDSVLDASFRGHSIASALQLAVDDAIELFDDQPAIMQPLELLSELGLGHLQLGRATPTLSGGEAQRLKLADALSNLSNHSEGLLFILDEPTAGLHQKAIQALINTFNRLIDGGKNTVVIIEHDLDVIRISDHIIDFGPGAGDEGGTTVYAGPPANAKSVKASRTGRALKSRRSSSNRKIRSGGVVDSARGMKSASEDVVAEVASAATNFFRRARNESERPLDEAAILSPTYNIQEGVSRFPLANRTLLENLRASEQLYKSLAALVQFNQQESVIHVRDERALTAVVKTLPTNSLITFSPVTALLESHTATRSALLIGLKRSMDQAFSEYIDGNGIVKSIESLTKSDLATADVFGSHVVAGRIGSGHNGTSVEQVRKGFVLGGGWVTIRPEDTRASGRAKRGTLHLCERPIDITQQRVGRRRLVPATFDSRDAGGCPYCRGTGIQTAVKWSLLVNDRLKSPCDAKFLTVDCMKMLKAVWNRSKNAMTHLEDEGLVSFSSPKSLSANQNWGTFLYGYPWANFLIEGRKGQKTVDFHVWPGLVPLVLGRLHLSKNQQWVKNVEESKKTEDCFYCEGTGFDWLARFYLLGDNSVAKWISGGTHRELLDYLKIKRPKGTKMIVETLQQIVSIGLGDFKISQICQDLNSTERTLIRSLAIDKLGFAEATYLVDAVAGSEKAAKKHLLAAAKAGIVIIPKEKGIKK